MKINTRNVIISLLITSILVISGCTSAGISSNSQGALQFGNEVPDATFTTIDGETAKLSDYRGEKVMFWFLATWCPSCIAGSEALQNNNQQLAGMKVIALKTFGNAGYKGPTIFAFAQKNSPNTLQFDNWIWGDASQEATLLYNSRNYPDIYFLIDENGILREVEGSPAATINKIIGFAQG